MALAAVVGVVGVGGGCEWFPPRGPKVVSPPAAFEPLTRGQLGAAHAYVVGVAPERLGGGREKDLARQGEQALLASIDAETVPVRANPADPVPGRDFPAIDAGRRARAEAAREAVAEVAPPAVSAGLSAGSSPAPAGDASAAPRTPTEGDLPVAPGRQPLPSTLAATARTADLNDDGFITLDEIVALHRAEVPGPEIARRLVATGFVLRATDPQLRHLRWFGVPESALAPFLPPGRRSR